MIVTGMAATMLADIIAAQFVLASPRKVMLSPGARVRRAGSVTSVIEYRRSFQDQTKP